MNILEEIIAHKRKEINLAKEQRPAEFLKESALFNRVPFSLDYFLQDSNNTGIIAEFKRRSPSKGIINEWAEPAAITKAYTENGAAALSVLTENHFFGGSNEDLARSRLNEIPILRKDFIIDDYQVLEAKAIGADVILLIAACLTQERTGELADLARQLQMEVLLEIHNDEELGHICEAVNHVGINNRDLKTFTVDVKRSIELGDRIPIDKTRIAESGIDNVQMIRLFRQAGFRGFLMGEKFMRQVDPGRAFKEFVEELQ